MILTIQTMSFDYHYAIAAGGGVVGAAGQEGWALPLATLHAALTALRHRFQR